MTFQGALDLLHDEKLVQTHRSFRFLQHILAIGSDSVIVDTKEPVQIPVTRNYYRRLMDHILILESGVGCGCDVSNVDSEESYAWANGPDDEPWEKEQGAEEEE